jgi:hypothetical protein
MQAEGFRVRNGGAGRRLDGKLATAARIVNVVPDAA